MRVLEMHATTEAFSRSTGRNAVAAAAYRSGERLTCEREGSVHDYTAKRGVEHSELVVPERAKEWATDREAVWNAMEEHSARRNAIIAREWRIGLPHELDAEQRRELAVEHGRMLSERYGVVADVAIHEPDCNGDERNYHAHILLSPREATEYGFGERVGQELSNAERRRAGLGSNSDDLREVREQIADAQNHRLRSLGIETHVEHRSFKDRGIELEPEKHVGPGGVGRERKEQDSDRATLRDERRERNAVAIEGDATSVLRRVTEKRATFTENDLDAELKRHFTDDERRTQAREAIVEGDQMVRLSGRHIDERTGEEVAPERFTTREMMQVEGRMIERARDMSENGGHGVSEGNVERALAARSYLSDEQKEAVRHVTAKGDCKIVVGAAGAGKSTTMAVAREAWEAEGMRVRGAALSGVAAQNLEDGSGIESRTLAGWQYHLDKGSETLGPNDVIVLDEAAMVGSRQTENFLRRAQEANAKVVMVGDSEQLQAIDAGAAFRVMAERTDYVELNEVRRQQTDWQREASRELSKGNVPDAFVAYDQRGNVHQLPQQRDASDQLVRDWYQHRTEQPEQSSIILAHTRRDTRELNENARQTMQSNGQLGQSHTVTTAINRHEEGVEVADRQFATGDRIMFMQNDRRLDVKNGTRGTITEFDGRNMTVRADDGRDRRLDVQSYRALDHGYAMTVHKSQGATTDRSFYMMGRNVDRHVSYVAMTRHRERLDVYGSDERFQGTTMAAVASRRRSQDSTLDYERAPASAKRDPVSELDMLRREQGGLRSRAAAGDDEARQRMHAASDAMRERAQVIHASPELMEKARERGLERTVEQHRPQDRGEQREQVRGLDRGRGIGD